MEKRSTDFLSAPQLVEFLYWLFVGDDLVGVFGNKVGVNCTDSLTCSAIPAYRWHEPVASRQRGESPTAAKKNTDMLLLFFGGGMSNFLQQMAGRGASVGLCSAAD